MSEINGINEIMENKDGVNADATMPNVIEAYENGVPAAGEPFQILLYDISAMQTFTFEATDDAGTYEFSHTFAPLAGREDALVRFDSDRSIEYSQTGKDTEIVASSAVASLRLWNELATAVTGYGEDDVLPPNWKEMVPEEDKVAAVRELLWAEIVIVDDDEKTSRLAGRRGWADTLSGEKTIRIRSNFSGREVITAVTFRPRTAADLMAYERIQGRIRLTRSGSLQIRPQLKAKGELFDRMLVSSIGYNSGIPLHHKALAITALFEATAETKKSNS